MEHENKNLEALKRSFLTLCRSAQRDGMYELLQWLETTDFFTAPASTRFHGNYQGGLLEHSLNVYSRLSGIVSRYPEKNIPKDSVVIVALFHDICKCNYYTMDYRNVKVYSENGSKRDAKGRFDWESQPCYRTEDRFPLGHGEKSVILLQRHIKLTDDEIYAIRWHMGGFDTAVKGGDFGQSKAFEICPLAAMAHLADMEATYLVEARDSANNNE